MHLEANRTRFYDLNPTILHKQQYISIRQEGRKESRKILKNIYALKCLLWYRSTMYYSKTIVTFTNNKSILKCLNGNFDLAVTLQVYVWIHLLRDALVPVLNTCYPPITHMKLMNYPSRVRWVENKASDTNNSVPSATDLQVCNDHSSPEVLSTVINYQL